MNIQTKAALAHLLDGLPPLKTKDADPIGQLSTKFGEFAEQVTQKLGLTNSDLVAIKKDSDGIKAQITELQQKLARDPGDSYAGGGFGLGGGYQGKSIGEQFAKLDSLRDFSDNWGRNKHLALELKTTITLDPASAGVLAPAERDTLLQMPKRTLTVRDLLTSVRVSSNSVEYPRMTARPSAAAPVAEAAAKPESAMTFDLVPVPIRTIAHWIPASRQVLDDAPQLTGLINSELLYGLKLVEEAQLLNGAGTGQNLSGLVTNSTAFSNPIAAITTPTSIEIIALAMLQAANNLLPADGIVVNPNDWTWIRLMKDTTGRYLIGDPAEAGQPRLWGLPVVVTPAMTVDKVLVGAFKQAATLYDRWAARVEVSTEHDDYFTKNMVAILAEERLGLAVKRPLGLIYADFGRV